MGEDEQSGRGPLTKLHGMVSDYLARRPAAALATDAIVLLVLRVVAELVWAATFDPMTQAEGMGAPVLIARALASLLEHVSWLLAGWAGLRLIAQAISTPRAAGAE